MESSLSHQIKVGIFTVVGIVMFCVSVILLGGDQFFLKKTYELKIKLPQVQGLARGSVVSLMGLPVGNVREINFISGSTDVEVLVNVEQAYQKRITQGSLASVKTQGALGDKYIYIEAGPLDAPAIQEGGFVETDRSPDILDVIAEKGAEIGEIVEVIKEVRKLFANINSDGKSAKLMGNLVQTTETLNQFLGEAKETMRIMRTETLAPMSSVMKKMDRGQGTMGALINDRSLHDKLSNFFGESPRNRFLKPLIRDSIQTNEKK
ncbi:MAG: MlaD family protein [Bdellovibrionales bacterium]